MLILHTLQQRLQIAAGVDQFLLGAGQLVLIELELRLQQIELLLQFVLLIAFGCGGGFGELFVEVFFGVNSLLQRSMRASSFLICGVGAAGCLMAFCSAEPNARSTSWSAIRRACCTSASSSAVVASGASFCASCNGR